MKIKAFGMTDKGLVRANNEDNFCIDEGTGLFVAADGMGGLAAGEVASKMAVDVIRDYFNNQSSKNEVVFGEYNKRFSDTTNKLASAIRLSNTAIYEAAQSNISWRSMGTTVAASMILKNSLSIAHVGDSRIYLIRANTISQVTDDHSVVAEQVKSGLLTKKEAEESNIRNIITRALGNLPEVDVDLDEIELMADDRIVLCSDGLTTMVTDEVILSTVLSENEPESACRTLINIANNNGGKDNITVIVIYIIKENWFRRILKFFIR